MYIHFTRQKTAAMLGEKHMGGCVSPTVGDLYARAPVSLYPPRMRQKGAPRANTR